MKAGVEWREVVGGWRVHGFPIDEPKKMWFSPRSSEQDNVMFSIDGFKSYECIVMANCTVHNYLKEPVLRVWDMAVYRQGYSP